MDLYRFDPTQIPSGHIGFRPMDLSSASSEWENQTAQGLDSAAILSDFNARYPETAERIAQDADQPLVLILHTHTTEGYSAEGAISWDGTGDFARSEDGESGVRAVGAVLASALAAFNMAIPVICPIVGLWQIGWYVTMAIISKKSFPTRKHEKD